MFERSSIISDNAEMSFKYAEDFQQFLTEMDKDSKWLEVEKNKELKVSFAGTSEEVIEGLTDESFNDTVINGSKAVVVCSLYVLPSLKIFL